MPHDAQTPSSPPVLLAVNGTLMRGLELNPKVKAATRDLALSFLNSLFAGDSGALGRWQERNTALLEKFETRLARQ